MVGVRLLTFWLLVLLFPLIFASTTTKKRGFEEYNSANTNKALIPPPLFTEEELRCQKVYQGEFERLVEICTYGKYHKIPLDYYFFCHRNPADYLALAIKARDLEAIAFSKNYVDVECPTVYLQSALLDMIFQEDTDVIEMLGRIFPDIYTNVLAFRDPMAHLSGTSLIRIAVDQNRTKAAFFMFKSVPVAMIGDFWQTIVSMRKFIIRAMEEHQIRLQPAQNEPGIGPKVLLDMMFNCILENNLGALDYLHKSTGISLKTEFTNEHNFTFTAMFIAAHAGYNDIVSYLGKKCPELFNIRTSSKMLPIHTAAANGHLDVIKALSVARETMTDSIFVSGTLLTPFGLAVRNNKPNAAFLILSLIENDDEIQNELKELIHWAILDDNVNLLDIYFEANSFPEFGCVDGSYNLLEMALTGSNNPKIYQNKHSSIKCLTKLIDIWKQKGLPFNVKHENFSGSILALVPPKDLDAFLALVKECGVDPNEPISTGTEEYTTFLNIIIAKGATELVRLAIKNGADPRIVDDDGLDAYETAVKYKNQYVVELFESIYQDY